MSLFGDIAGGVLTGGMYNMNKALLGGYGNPASRSVPGAPVPRNPWTARDIKIDPSLTAAFGGVGTSALNAIKGNYANAASRTAGEAGARGLPSGSNSYAPQRFSTQQGLDIGNLESALGGEVGNTAYENAKQIRDYGQNAQLAEETAALNKPSLLDEIFSGVGAVGKPLTTYAGIKGRRGFGNGNSGSNMANIPSSYDYMDMG